MRFGLEIFAARSIAIFGTRVHPLSQKSICSTLIDLNVASDFVSEGDFAQFKVLLPIMMEGPLRPSSRW